MKGWFGGIAHNSKGATAIEYGLILAVIALVMLVGLSQLATTNGGIWGHVVDRVINHD